MNSINPTGGLSPAARKAIQEALVLGIVRPILPAPLPPHLIPPSEDFRGIDPEYLKRRLLQQQEGNVVQAEPRAPKDQEAAALIFTFGDFVGTSLNNIIESGQEGAAVEGQIRTVLPGGYHPDNLDALATFIYKATRIWQKEAGLYNEDEAEEGEEKADYDYNYTQLYSTETVKALNGTQHAAAVRDWFYVNYGIETGVVGYDKNRKVFEQLWDRTLGVLRIKKMYRSAYRTKFGKDYRGGQDGALQYVVNNHYSCVIKEIRDPIHLER